ncbi:uncharacterized protein LOC130664381 [Microplitis mediator]|uniref:uncharacterized protein LOC130664381 n=1 Tax=Microplitis mediator TaxID=375433 RepID=UPI0025525960|nr:uncharacterized protein LOC130664381 [Microplitis mediator]XP_057320175.1 uncharacterized protein LOC130664381 [Microplitis mediator]
MACASIEVPQIIKNEESVDVIESTQILANEIDSRMALYCQMQQSLRDSREMLNQIKVEYLKTDKTQSEIDFFANEIDKLNSQIRSATKQINLDFECLETHLRNVYEQLSQLNDEDDFSEPEEREPLQ